jgi:hypothetical protein
MAFDPKIPDNDLPPLPPEVDDRFAILIPIYDHAAGIGPVMERARGLGLPIWIVDDGSTDGTAELLATIEGGIVCKISNYRFSPLWIEGTRRGKTGL